MGLVKDFEDTRALNNFTIDIGSGIFGLIGPNGAGKTTFLRILLGLIQPDSGTAKVFGLRIDKDSLQIRERLGILHERPIYPKGMTPLSFLNRVRDIYGKGVEPRSLLKLVGLATASKRKIGSLSAGMTQRLGIAQALISEPELVFLDEPTSNLDVAGREEITQLIVNLHNELGTSFIIASHVLSELERICNSVAFIRNGTIIEQGKTLDLIDKFTKNRFKVITNEPRQLALILEKLSIVESVRVVGISSVAFSTKVSQVILEDKIKDAILQSNIQIHSILKSNSLEDTYKEVMTDDY